jgi:hypothetical protein
MMSFATKLSTEVESMWFVSNDVVHPICSATKVLMENTFKQWIIHRRDAPAGRLYQTPE